MTPETTDRTVLLIGAGGIGCGAAFALAAAGVRRFVVIDPDRVDETNLHRQILHAPESVGELKVHSMAHAMEKRFPGVGVTGIEALFDTSNAGRLVSECDVLVDGSDNLATKFLANDAAVLGGKPLVHGAAVASGGQLLTIPVGGRPCYRCLFEDLPPADAGVASCDEAGVLGPVPGVIGALQAAEALRLLRGESPAFTGRLIRYDSRLLTMRAVRFRPNPTCKVCGDNPTIASLDPSAYNIEECVR